MSPQTLRSPLLDLKEAADYLKVSRTTFFELRKSPDFPEPIRLNGKTLYLVDDLLEYALSRKCGKRC